MTLQGIAPIVPVPDETVSAAFFTEVLGFELRLHLPETRYALVARDEAAVVLIGTDDPEPLKATRQTISAYIWVADLDALWAELGPRLSTLPEGRVRAPFTQDYGMREFHVIDPSGLLLFFGADPTV